MGWLPARPVWSRSPIVALPIPTALLLSATVSSCFLAADRMRCNLKLPGMTQNGESSAAYQGMEMNLLTFSALASAGLAAKKKFLFFKACRYCCEVSMRSPRRSALIP